MPGAEANIWHVGQIGAPLSPDDFHGSRSFFCKGDVSCVAYNVVEFAFSSPREHSGLAYEADTWQMSAETIAPLNTDAGIARVSEHNYSCSLMILFRRFWEAGVDWMKMAANEP